MWWRKPCAGLDGHGTYPKGRCEGSPEPSEVSSLGKLSVFSKSLIETLGYHSLWDWKCVLAGSISRLGGLKLDIISSLFTRKTSVYLHEFKSILIRGEGINEMG